MYIDYAYHIIVDGKVIFLDVDLQIEVAGTSKVKFGILEKIGPKGIYVRFPNLKNAEFINFNKIANLKEV